MTFLKSVSPNVRNFIIADGFYYGGYAAVNAFLSVLITYKIAPGRLDIVGYVVSYYMLVRATMVIPLSRFTNKLSIITKRDFIAYGYILYGVLFFLLGHSIAIWQIFFIQTTLGLLDAAIYPIKWTIFTKILDKGSEELEWGLGDISSTLLPAISAALAGFISANFGLEYAFLLFAIFLIISGVTFFSIKQSDNLDLEP